jgi:fructose-1-phosphate kinase PfkB-like protein
MVSAAVQRAGHCQPFQVVQGRTRINVKLTEKTVNLTFSGFEVTPATGNALLMTP